MFDKNRDFWYNLSTLKEGGIRMKVSRMRVATGAILYLSAGDYLCDGLANQDPMLAYTGVIGACAGTLFVAGAIRKAEEEAEKQTKDKTRTR